MASVTMRETIQSDQSAGAVVALRLLPAAVRTSVLARLASDRRVTLVELVRDLAPLLSHRLAQGPLRDLLAAVVDVLVTEGLARDERGRIELTDRGVLAVRVALAPVPLPKDWAGFRDCRLVALALGITDLSAARLRGLRAPEGLRTAVLQRAHGLPFAGRTSAATLRNQLAMIALGKAFGDPVKAQIRARDGLPPRTARVLAGQLARRPRDLGTDNRLIATLAAEAVGAFQTDADAVRVALLRRWLGASIDAVSSQPVPAKVESREVIPEAARPLSANRPGLDGFIAAVLAAADQKADGWPGNRKAPIARVFDQMTLLYPSWGVSETEFKSMLLEAHRLGRLTLATADLKSRDKLGEIERSAIAFKNAILHFIRVDV